MKQPHFHVGILRRIRDLFGVSSMLQTKAAEEQASWNWRWRDEPKDCDHDMIQKYGLSSDVFFCTKCGWHCLFHKLPPGVKWRN